jgi:predicted NBD/HSP70 family sugar kinase
VRHDTSDGRPIRARAGTNLGGASAHNRRVVIDALRLNGALSRAEIARSTHLTPQAVSNIAQELQAAGLVAAGDAIKLARGQPAIPYRLVPNGALAIGLHIDRHYARCVAVNLVGEALAREGRPLPPGGPVTGVPVVLDLLRRVLAQIADISDDATQRIVGLGMAMPGPFGVRRDQSDEWMMAEWQAFPLVETVTEATGLKVRLVNDATASAIAERLTGVAHGLSDLVFIFLGYGLGSGIVIDGDVYEGAHGNAGEIGEILMRLPGPGATTSGPATIPTPVEHDASLASLARALDVPAGEQDMFDAIETALATKDPRLDRWTDVAAQQLRRSVQIVESLFDPETVIIGGEAPMELLEQLHKKMMPLLPSVSDRPDRTHPRLVVGTADRWAVALGAGTEPISRAFDPRFSAILKSAKA